MLSIGGVALAQQPTPGADTATCRSPTPRTEKTSAFAAPTPAPSRKRQKACWIDLAQVDPQAKPGRAVYWVDIRSPRQANALPLPGVVRIAPAEIAHKPFLRQAMIILVGTGWDETALLATCGQLREAGVADVRALRGGARAWQAAGHPVVPVAQGTAWDEMDAVDFITAAAQEHWPVLAIDLPVDAQLPVPAARLARVSSKRSWSLVQLFPAVVRRHEPVIALALNQPEQERWRAQLAANRSGPGVDNLVWVRGGYTAYRDARERQQAIAGSRGRIPAPPCGGG